MLKPTFILILGLLIFQKANAQTDKDTIVYYLKNSGKIVPNKDSADYVLINMPADAGASANVYPVTEYYHNGNRKFIGYTRDRSSRLMPTGVCTSFYPNGKRKSTNTYNKSGLPVGDIITYYPNGQLYTVEKYKDNNEAHNFKLLLMECRDSTGKILAVNGNGEWLKFSVDFKKLLREGPVKNGIEDGAWTMAVDDKKLGFVYTNGIVTTPIDYDFANKIFALADVNPAFKGGIEAFYSFLAHTVRYPKEARENNVQGKVFVSFVIEKDGTLTDVRAVRAPTKEMGDEAVRAIQSSPPWIPGTIAGAPVRVTYTVPINFTLGNSRR